uniref:Insulinase family protein n=1 Tax=candidate division CPR3 bacterium TaxID=2268181 RepID=A0A7C4R5Q3_UNCC3
MDLKYSRFKLKNGLRVIMVPRKETEAVFFEVLCGVGSRYETDDIAGISHFLEHMAFKGTKKRAGTLDISKEIDQVGGTFNAFTYDDLTAYFIKLHSDKIELAIDIISDMLINSKLEEKEIDKEKGVILEEYKMGIDDPDYFAVIKIEELLYGKDTPLGRWIMGKTETIKAINRKKIIDFKNKFYNPDNMVIAIGGNINQTEVKKLLEKYFGKIKGKTKESFKKNHTTQPNPQIEIYKKPIEQAKVIIAFRSFGRDHKDRYVRGIISKILGGYMSSKLFMEIREKKGLAYNIRTYTDAYEEIGCLGIVGGFVPEKVPEALKETIKLVNQAKEKGFTQEEIKMAKENSIGKLALSLESASEWAEGIAVNVLYGIPIETLDEMESNINKVTNQDIKRVAKEIFQPENFNMVVVGPIDEKKKNEYLKLIKL